MHMLLINFIGHPLWLTFSGHFYFTHLLFLIFIGHIHLLRILLTFSGHHQLADI